MMTQCGVLSMYIMNYEDLKQLITGDEHIQLELKKTTGELKDGMHTACAFLNTDGGWLIFGVAPKSLKILGQQVTDNTQREIAQYLGGLEPAINADIQYIDVSNTNNNYWCPVKLFCVPKIKVGFLAWNPTFFVTFVFVTKPK